MLLVVNLILIAATIILFLKLITTNHWTVGKKNLVTLVFCLLWKLAIEIAYVLNFISFNYGLTMIVANLPLTLGMIAISLIVHWFDH